MAVHAGLSPRGVGRRKEWEGAQADHKVAFEALVCGANRSRKAVFF